MGFREEELRASGEITDEENKNIIKSIVDPMPELLVNDEMDFEDINFSPNTTDNMYKLPSKVEKHLDEMVIDALPKLEQDLYIDNDLDSFMFAVFDSENNSDSMVIDVKPKTEQVKRKVDSDVEGETKKSTYLLLKTMLTLKNHYIQLSQKYLLILKMKLPIQKQGPLT